MMMKRGPLMRHLISTDMIIVPKRNLLMYRRVARLNYVAMSYGAAMPMFEVGELAYGLQRTPHGLSVIDRILRHEIDDEDRLRTVYFEGLHLAFVYSETRATVKKRILRIFLGRVNSDLERA